MVVRQPNVAYTNVHRTKTSGDPEHGFTTMHCEASAMETEMHPEELSAALRRLRIDEDHFWQVITT